MVKSPKKLVNRSETVRERSDNTLVKTRRLSRTANSASKPLIWLGNLLKTIIKPFSFVLIPFKSRPMRFIGRTLATITFAAYFYGSWKELRDVQWPNRKETTKLTTAVFLFAVVFALLIAVVDFGLDKVFREVLVK